MRLEHLTYIIEISRLKSISKAAETLHISQPALSAAIKNLEEELGKSLFKRTNRGISLTADGERITGEAVSVLKVLNSWYSQISVLSPHGEIHLAVTPIISSYISPNIIVPFQKLYPDITVFVHSAQDFDIVSRLKSSNANIAISTLSPNSRLLPQIAQLGWVSLKLYTDERRLFLGASHEMAKKTDLTLADLKKLNLAWYSDPRDRISSRYAPYFGSSYRMANKEDILDLVTNNVAAYIQPFHLFRHDYRVRENLVVARQIPCMDVDPRVDIYAMHIHDISELDSLFWNFLVENFTINL